ncbi:BZ3500_MvSof-1268-A1-R1_Chr4-2g07155 [Microbotryum saponariae]|uniref:BZ3500_MvSof-1268-A1-R1_Chr4-2g07155 protein n=1 Tax=Microbotryum saponariae TaxID=289078 RepID=A0A2X0LN95_9BASI|nr:BZ3500_MvSof-1268-A1-R1_Chr4-2g07155 [Microbotryum saponariae]SDA06820.1 BZ3501_MvSof-1269-A2-R1_Chr4-2g06866 [Microbotryum saponariae]
MALCMVDHGRQTRSIRALEDSHFETRQGRVRSPSSCASSDGDDSVVFGAKRSSTTTTITTDAGPSSASVPTALGSVVDQGRKRSARLSRRDTVVVRPDVVAVSLLDGSSSSSSSSPVSNRQSTTGEQRASPLRVSSPLRMASPLVSATPNKTSSPLKPTHSLNDSRPSSPFPSTHSNANDQQNSPTLPPSSPRSRPPTPSNLHLASPLRPGSPLRFATAGVGSRPGTPSGLRAFWPVQDDFPAVQDEEQLQRMLRVVVKEGRMALATEVGRVGSYEEERVRALGDYDDATTYTGFFDEAHTIQNHAATQEHDEEDESLPHMPYVTMRDLQPPAAALELLHSTNSTTVETEHMFHHPRRAIDYDDDELTDTDSPWEVDEVSFAAGSGREGEVDMQGVGLDEGMVKCFEEFGSGEEGEAEEQGEAEGKEEERGLEESDELGEEEEGERENQGNETESESEAEQDDFDLFNPVDEAQQLVNPAEEADSPDNEEEEDVAVDHETEQEEDGEGTPETSIPSSPPPSPENEVDTELECDDGLPEQSAERAVPVPFRPVQHPEFSSTSSTEEHQDTEEETASSDVVETPAAKSPAPSPTKTPVVPSVVKEQWAALTAAPTTRRQLAKPREIFKPVTKGGQLKSRLGGGASSAVPVPRAMLAGPSTSTQASSSATNSAVPSTSSSPASKRVALTSKKVVPAPTATARPVVVRKIASPTPKVPIPSSSATVPSTRLPSATTKPVTKQTVPRSKPTLTEGTSSTIPSSHLAAATAPASPRRSPRKPSPPTDHHARSNSSASTASSSSTTAAPVAATRPRVMAAPGASATRVAAAAARRAAAASTANENMAKKPGPRPAMTTTLRTNHTIVATEGRVIGAPSATTLARQPLGRPGSRIIAGPSASNIAAALVRRPASALSTASTASSVEVTVQQIVVPVAMPPAPSTPVAGCPPAPELPLLPRPAPLASAAPRSPEKKAQRVKDGVVTTKQVDLEIARPPSALGTASRGGLAKTPSLVSAGYTSPIRSKPQLLPPPLPLPRTGLFGLGPTASSDSILTASTESLDPLTSAIAAKDVFAPSAPARELLPPPLPRPTRQTKLLTEDRVAPATPVSEQPTALLPRPVRRKKPSIDTTETPIEPLTPRPVLTFQPAPVLTQDELTRLTQRNTKKNQLHFNHHQVIVTHLEVPRPPSPTSKIRKSIGEHGVSGATSVGREARAAKRRNALRSSTDGSEVDLLNSELDAARGAFAAVDGVVRVEQLKTTHYRAPGDEEQYSSPVRPSTSSNGNKKRGSGATKKTSVGSAPARRVKWDKALVYEGPMEGQGEVKVDGILKVKAPLDSFGNLTVNNGSLGKAVPVQIKKLIYIDDPPE